MCKVMHMISKLTVIMQYSRQGRHACSCDPVLLLSDNVAVTLSYYLARTTYHMHKLISALVIALAIYHTKYTGTYFAHSVCTQVYIHSLTLFYPLAYKLSWYE